ncbi:RES family NAD+ phosphorylase [Sphingomonas oligophenolica]|uniref:RES family NAD+ phosphorylase n=1 Tax=Sphingomonas oligophenolica TaxID=301154 RepID=UPI0031F50D46
MGFGKNPTRFSDPRRRVPDSRFGVLYLGSSLKVCFLETILRDDRDGVVGDVEVEEKELDDRLYAEVRVRDSLRLLDLTGDGPVRMGIPSDVLRGSQQALARKWSVAFYDHPAAIDGILYPSRLNGQTNLAIYDRSVLKLEPLRSHNLKRAPGMADLLDYFFVALI